MIFRLPWPPSVNHYWRHVGRKTLLSAEGRSYRRTVAAALLDQSTELGFIAGITRPTIYTAALAVTITAHQADGRRRDLDNLIKATLDALQHAGLYEDDNQVDQLTICRAHGPAKPSFLTVTVEPID